jgi:hypothetical protein
MISKNSLNIFFFLRRRHRSHVASLPPLLLLPLRRVRQVLAQREAARRDGVQPDPRPVREQRAHSPQKQIHLPQDQRRGRHGVTATDGGRH